MKHFFSIIFLLVTCTAMGQSLFSDSTKAVITNDLEQRLPEQWIVTWSTNRLEILLIDSNGIYRYFGDLQFYGESTHFRSDKALVKWYKTEYLDHNPDYGYASDTLTISVDFDLPWTEIKTDSAKRCIDSATTVIKATHQKKYTCDNYYWDPYKSKQVIPFYSDRLSCSCFFDDGAMYRRGCPMVVQYENSIPRLVSMADEVFMIKQIVAMTLGVQDCCFECDCKK